MILQFAGLTEWFAIFNAQWGFPPLWMSRWVLRWFSLAECLFTFSTPKFLFQCTAEWVSQQEIFEWAIASSVKIDDHLWIFSALTLRTSPPSQEGIESLPAGGFASQGSRPSPPCQEGIESLPASGFASRARAKGFRRPPTRQEGYLPPREVALVHGGHNPITPQSKTTSDPPAPRYMFWLR